MRALESLHERLTNAMRSMHRGRWKALWRATRAVLTGGQLWLTALGRARTEGTSPKHGIKAIDRLLGNTRLHREVPLVYASIAQVVLRRRARPIVLVDSVDIVPNRCALVAAVASDGRALPIASMVTTIGKPKSPVLRQFVNLLAAVLPAGCRPVVVTDAGFESTWFELIEERGWDYVGRLRNRTSFLTRDGWVSRENLLENAGQRAKSLGTIAFPRSPQCRSRERRLVLSKKPKSRHRQRVTRKGTPGQRKQDKRHRKGANEPWLLATSLTCAAQDVVDLYGLRMQIEEVFRDEKNHRWGWSLRHCRTRCDKRLDVLLMLGALAYLLQQLVGVAAERLNLQRHHQANTVRNRRVLSFFVLGSLVLHGRDLHALTPASLTSALAHVRRIIADLEVV